VKRPLSLTARISLLFALSAAAVLMFAGASFERALNARLLKRDIEELSGKMQLVRDIVLSARAPEELSSLPIRMQDVVFGHPGIILSVRSGDGSVLFSTGDQQVARELQDELTPAGAKPLTRRFGEKYYRYLAMPVSRGSPEGGPLKVTIALDVTEDRDFLQEVQEYVWLGVLEMVVVLGALGWAVVRHGLGPLRSLSAMVAATSTRQLDKPLDDKAVPRELLDLVRAFNAMLARLHESFRRLTDFSSDIAHELRTPIQNLLTQTQVTLSGADDLETCRGVLQSNVEEYQRLSRMISDMLFLAKADNRQATLHKESVALEAEVRGLFEFYEALASEQGIELRQAGAAIVPADRAMVQRALSNLLSNALRFTPQGRAIDVDIGTEDGRASIAVTNPGPEIPAEHRERIFERLYRVDPSRRQGGSDNVGLGLAITKSIVEMHGGDIRVESGNARVTFVIRLPLAGGPPETSHFLIS
jgi:two-component system heavy metal sensor histidine kinase CusS